MVFSRFPLLVCLKAACSKEGGGCAINHSVRVKEIPTIRPIGICMVVTHMDWWWGSLVESRQVRKAMSINRSHHSPRLPILDLSPASLFISNQPSSLVEQKCPRGSHGVRIEGGRTPWPSLGVKSLGCHRDAHGGVTCGLVRPRAAESGEKDPLARSVFCP